MAAFAPSLFEYFRTCLTNPQIVNSVKSTLKEREDMGVALLEISLDWKRILSPMLTYQICQEALILLFRESQGNSLRNLLVADLKIQFNKLLEDLKALPEKTRNKLIQRHEKWIDALREQVDVTGDTTVKRIVNEDELGEILKLGEQMKTTGNESFGNKDYRMAVVRYLQAIELIKKVDALKPEGKKLLEDLWKVCHRNLSLASLKTWEWGRVIKSAHAVLSLDEDDMLVRLRRAEAFGAIGRFEEAFQDIAYILKEASSSTKRSSESSSGTQINTIVVKKTKQLSSTLKNQLNKSDLELKKAMSQGLSKGTFSTDRPSTHSTDEELESPLQKHLKAKWAAERNVSIPTPSSSFTTKTTTTTSTNSINQNGLKKEDVPFKTTTNTQGSENMTNRIANAKSSQLPRLEIQTVLEIQKEQLHLFSSEEVQAELNSLRSAADFEEQRFLYRVRKYKVQVHDSLLKKHNFEVSEVGLSLFERAIAAHMAQDQVVSANMKEIAKLIMGVVWEDSS